MLFGLWREEGIWNLFLYVLPEIIILSAIMGQNYFEILIGLYDKREIDLENIEEARERFLEQFNEDSTIIEDQVLKIDRARKIVEEEDMVLDENHKFTYDERIARFPKKIMKIKAKVI